MGHATRSPEKSVPDPRFPPARNADQHVYAALLECGSVTQEAGLGWRKWACPSAARRRFGHDESFPHSIIPGEDRVNLASPSQPLIVWLIIGIDTLYIGVSVIFAPPTSASAAPRHSGMR